MTGPFELVIFDCDGVLVDSERLAVRIDALVLGKMGWPLTEEEIVEALDRIAIPTCVASSGSHAKMRMTLGRTGLFDRFEGRIFSGKEVANGKPAPDLFLHTAARMGVPPVPPPSLTRAFRYRGSQGCVRGGRIGGNRCFGPGSTA